MKRLITCSDGTWNKPGTKDGNVEVSTNVYKMYQCIFDKDLYNTPQLKFYDAGVGTSSNLLDKMMGGISGSGIDQNIKDVYTFFVKNYEEGDELYLFGFSRGAYTARSAAGMIRNCGILKKENLNKIDEAYDLYRERGEDSKPDSEKSILFKMKYSYDPRIKFIGVWDTVGALGIPLSWFHSVNNKRYKFHDTTLSSKVDFAYHALALDEKRKLFEPTIWNKSKSASEDPLQKQVMEQQWFAGVHSNVGGGYKCCGLSDIALQWLIEKAEKTGLHFDSEHCKNIQCNYAGELRNSYTFGYWLWPKKSRTVIINDRFTNQNIHESVLKRISFDSSYRPKNIIDHIITKNISLKTKQILN